MFQCDFFNCYGGSQWSQHALPGHDIEDGRCTWLIVLALQRATPAQKLAIIVNRFLILSSFVIM